jgi:BirA family biotin operon repressor/biotin-[acetyl-CoA-carboxylase] ligase
MSHSRALLAKLADGDSHPTSALALELGVASEAIAELATELRELGIEVVVTDRGELRLVEPIELLDAAAIREVVTRSGHVSKLDLDVLFMVGSTNDYLFAPTTRSSTPRVVLAEIQQAGRGRRGRTWIAPFGSGLTFSVGWTFERPPQDLSALSLAIGVEVARVLHEAGAVDVRLKWPNDIVCQGRKLGGILTQLRSEPAGPAYVVIGVGLNFALPQEASRAIETDLAGTPGDLRSVLGAGLPGRNEMAGRLVARMLAGVEAFGMRGFAAFEHDWKRFDALESRPVRLEAQEGRVDGIARGVDRDGALIVEVDGNRHRFVSGEVTVRARSPEAA